MTFNTATTITIGIIVVMGVVAVVADYLTEDVDEDTVPEEAEELMVTASRLENIAGPMELLPH